MRSNAPSEPQPGPGFAAGVAASARTRRRPSSPRTGRASFLAGIAGKPSKPVSSSSTSACAARHPPRPQPGRAGSHPSPPATRRSDVQAQQSDGDWSSRGRRRRRATGRPVTRSSRPSESAARPAAPRPARRCRSGTGRAAPPVPAAQGLAEVPTASAARRQRMLQQASSASGEASGKRCRDQAQIGADRGVGSGRRRCRRPGPASGPAAPHRRASARSGVTSAAVRRASPAPRAAAGR